MERSVRGPFSELLSEVRDVSGVEVERYLKCFTKNDWTLVKQQLSCFRNRGDMGNLTGFSLGLQVKTGHWPDVSGVELSQKML